MRFRLRDIPGLVKTAVGRREIIAGQRAQLEPVLIWIASGYRRFFLRNVRIVTVIGSLGKTTTVRAVTLGLGLQIHPHIAFNTRLALAYALLRIRPWAKYGVIEVGISRQGMMREYAGLIRPHIVVVTSIASEHNSSFKTLEVTRLEKAEMLKALPENGLAFLNGDDANVMWMARHTKARVITFGLDAKNDVCVTNVVNRWPKGMEFSFKMGARTRTIHTRLVGRHMIYPILAAAAVADSEGLDAEEVLQRLAGLEASRGRMQTVYLDNGAIIIRDDFKSSLETIHEALNALSEIPADRKIVVLGDVTEPPGKIREIYPDVGKKVGKIASRAIFLGHRKSCRYYKSAAKSAGLPEDRITYMGHDLAGTVRILKEELAPGDVVLLKGRNRQAFARISLALQGMDVSCNIQSCTVWYRDCEICPMLGTEWNGLPTASRK